MRIKKYISILLSIFCILALAGCEKTLNIESETSNGEIANSENLEKTSTPKLTLNQELLQYKEMTYQQFKEQTNTEAELYHANFYIATIPEMTIDAIFTAEEYDEELATAVLSENDKIIRFQGKSGNIFPDLKEEMALENLVAKLAWNDIAPEYTIEEGAGTAYYVGDQYTNIWIDSDGDSCNDLLLQIALDQSETIYPDSYMWLSWECEK